MQDIAKITTMNFKFSEIQKPEVVVVLPKSNIQSGLPLLWIHYQNLHMLEAVQSKLQATNIGLVVES